MKDLKPYQYFLIGGLLIILFSSLGYAIDTDYLISYYSFDDSTTQDNYGVNDGTVTGGTVSISSSCVVNNCNEYTAGFLNIGQDSSIGFTNLNNFSVCEWVKTSDTSNYQRFFFKAKSSSAYDGIWFGKGDSAQTNRLYSQIYGNTGDIGKRDTVSLSDGNWHFICFTYDGTNTRTGLKLYKDNIELTTTELSATLGTFDNSIYDGFIGGDSLGTSFTGFIDEVSIWNKTLNITELTDLYNSGNGYNPIPIITAELNTNIINNSLYSINDFNYGAQNGITFYYNISNFEANNQCKITTLGIVNSSRTDFNITTNKGFALNYLNTEGYQDYNFYCNDSTNILNKTYTIFIDGVKPLYTTNFINNITFIYPNVLFNLSVNLTATPNLNKFNVSIFNETNLIYLDSFLLNTSTYQYLKEINLSYNNVGNYSLIINAFDNSTNLNTNYYNFEILPNNIPYISSYTDLTNTTDSENINIYIVCEDTEQIDLITYVEWYINNINYFNDSKITTNGTNETFILLSGYLSEYDEVYFKTYCYDYLNYSNITISSIDYIFSVSGLDTEILLSINDTISKLSTNNIESEIKMNGTIILLLANIVILGLGFILRKNNLLKSFLAITSFIFSMLGWSLSTEIILTWAFIFQFMSAVFLLFFSSQESNYIEE